MTRVTATPRVLHLHGSLAADSPLAARCVRLIEAFGGRLRHTMVSADGGWSALDRITKGIAIERREGFPRLTGAPLPGRLQAIAQAMADYHLVLTYGWGGLHGALAHTLFSQLYGLPPLIHHEDGSDQPARQRQGLRSTWYRRVGLGRAAGLVVPTERMEAEALERWQQPLGRVKTIRDGVDLARLSKTPSADAIPRLLKRPGERWIGCLAQADAIGVAALHALRAIDARWHLVIAGKLPPQLSAAITGLALDDRVHALGSAAHADTLAALSDIVLVPGRADPLPHDALLAMGAGKPVIGFETGDLAAGLAADNAVFICKPGADSQFAAALEQLAEDDFLRRRTGDANREKAAAERDAKAMIASYRRLYASAMGRDTI